MTTAAKTVDPKMTLTADPQDPLPESNWVPRRWYVFPLTGALLLLIYVAIKQGAPASVTISLVAAVVIVAMFYLLAPSGEQIAKMAASVAAMRAGVSFRSSSSVDTESGTASSSSSATAPAPDKPEKVASE